MQSYLIYIGCVGHSRQQLMPNMVDQVEGKPCLKLLKKFLVLSGRLKIEERQKLVLEETIKRLYSK